jgi:nitroreductase
MKNIWIGIVLAGWTTLAGAQELKDVALPAPHMDGGMPLMQAIKARQSLRDYSDKKLSPQTLADLLWAANGINRPESGMRTAPSTMNWQEIEVYAVLEDGAYLYDPKANSLKAVVKGDLRKLTGKQAFAATAPLNLVFVGDMSRTKGVQGPALDAYVAADASFVSQNVYLFCASEGLATVVRGLVDKTALGEALKLPETKKVIFAQTVGYPAAPLNPKP